MAAQRVNGMAVLVAVRAAGVGQTDEEFIILRLSAAKQSFMMGINIAGPAYITTSHYV